VIGETPEWHTLWSSPFDAGKVDAGATRLTGILGDLRAGRAVGNIVANSG
jgi:hypothetical protein